MALGQFSSQPTACEIQTDQYHRVEVSPGSPPVMVEFPSDAPVNNGDVRFTRPPYLPFRRISLPPPPVLANRLSFVSTTSLESSQEEGALPPPVLPSLMRAVNKGQRNRPSSMEAARRNGKKRETRVIDEQRATKRRKVIDEFYETERSYVDGLELIYSVRMLCHPLDAPFSLTYIPLMAADSTSSLPSSLHWIPRNRSWIAMSSLLSFPTSLTSGTSIDHSFLHSLPSWKRHLLTLLTKDLPHYHLSFSRTSHIYRFTLHSLLLSPKCSHLIIRCYPRTRHSPILLRLRKRIHDAQNSSFGTGY